jgi:adenylate cyclase
MAVLPGKIYEFSSFRLDLSDRLLVKSGKPLPLTPKAFEVLRFLVERRGRLVEKDDLMREVWADAFVEEANLSRIVWVLRKALEDDGNGNRFIQTVPKHGYRFIADVMEISDDAQALETSITSLAVLPFENRSGIVAHEYLADGVTEGLIAGLSLADGLRVIAPRSVFLYKATSKTPQEIGRELNVEALMAGSFYRKGEAVRINVKLINAATGQIIWLQNYAGNWREILYLQNDISSCVANVIGASTRTRPNDASKIDPQAYDLYLRARFRLRKEDQNNTDEAITLLEKATMLDPRFAHAFAELARAYNLKSYFFTPEDRQWHEKAFIAAERANLIKADLPELHLLRGLLLWTHTEGFRHEETISEYKRALEINPNFDEVRHQLAMVYHHIGLFDRAIANYSLAIAINPANNIIRAHYAGALSFQFKCEDALFMLDCMPDGVATNINYLRSWNLCQLNRLEEALTVVDSGLESKPHENGLMFSIKAVIAAHYDEEQRVEENIKRSIEVGKGFGHFHHAAYNFVEAYAILNRPEPALKWLQFAAADGFPCYPLFAEDPALENLRQNPHFIKFMAKQREVWEGRMASL